FLNYFCGCNCNPKTRAASFQKLERGRHYFGGNKSTFSALPVNLRTKRTQVISIEEPRVSKRRTHAWGDFFSVSHLSLAYARGSSLVLICQVRLLPNQNNPIHIDFCHRWILRGCKPNIHA